MRSHLSTIVICILVITIGFILPSTDCQAQNKLYVIEKKAPELYSNPREDSKQINSSKVLLSLQRGDTVVATEETDAFIADRENEWLRCIPVKYKGVAGYVYAYNLRPVKAEPTDSIYPLHEKPLEKLYKLDRDLLKWQTTVMNLPVDSLSWLWLYLIGLGAALVFIIVGKFVNFLPTLFDVLVFVALSVVSLSQLLYFLAMGDHAFWFYNPKYVGWGWAILGFFATIGVLVFQVVIFCSVCNNYFDGTRKNRNTPLPVWIQNMGLYPFFVAVATILMYIVNAFISHRITLLGFAAPYIFLPVMGIAGAVYLFSKAKIIRGLFYPILYTAASMGICIWITTLGLTILLMAVAVGAVALILGALAGGSRGANGETRFKGRTVKGKRVTGWLSRDKTHVHGDDGNTYYFDE